LAGRRLDECEALSVEVGMGAAKPLADAGGKLVGVDSEDPACCPVGADG
jgi:hypothetical protein